MNQLTPLLDGICYLYKGKDIIRKGVCSIRKGVCLEKVPVRQEPTRPFYNCLRLVQAGINPIINTWLINCNSKDGNLPMSTGTRGYRTRMGKVCAQFYTHG